MNHDWSGQGDAPDERSDAAPYEVVRELPHELRAIEAELRAARPRPPAGLRDAILEATRTELQRERRMTAWRFAAAALLVAWAGLHGLRSLTSIDGIPRISASANTTRSSSLEPSGARIRELREMWPTAEGAETVALATWLDVRAETLHDATRRARVELGVAAARRGS